MPTFTKSKRQEIIDGYLAATGANLFVPADFIDWLSGQQDHEAYQWFFGKDDASAAREYRITLARQMASGMRITVRSSEITRANVVGITVREYPAYVSPVATRSSGGGYVPFEPTDAGHMAELRRQGATALRSWLARYGAAFADCDLSSLEAIAADEGRRALSA